MIASSWLGMIGLAIGSFLNVVIARVPEGRSIVRPGSRCPKCERALRWYENVPVFSFAIQRGRCRGCGQSISWRYPLVELLTGALFLACVARFGWTLDLVRALLLVTLLVPLTFIDLEHWLLPFALTLPGIAASVLTAIPLGMDGFRDAVIGAAAGFVTFWLLEIIGAKIFRKEALGGGDKFLLALIGGFLTYRPLLGVIFLSSLQGALVGSVLLAVRGRAGPASSETVAADDDWQPGPTNLPFGPWLAVAALEVLLLGPLLVRVLPPALAPLFGDWNLARQ